MTEQWRALPDFEDEYEISSFGRIRNAKGRIRALFLQPTGYVTIGLKKKKASLRVHKLVATAFIRTGKPGEQINHIDLNKANNRIENLEWCTAKENVAHAIRNNRGGGQFRLTEPQVLSIRERYAAGESSAVIASDHGLTRSFVYRLCSGLYYQGYGGPRVSRRNYPKFVSEVHHDPR